MQYEKLFSALQIDAIGEILNISLGSSATAVSNMLDKRVDITTPHVEVVALDEFEFTALEPAVGVEITYIQGLEGNNILLLKRSDIRAIVGILMGMEFSEEEFELDEMNLSAICEVMNQMMGASSTALAEFLGEPVNISTPISFAIEDADEFKRKYFSSDEPMVVVRFNLHVEDAIDSEFINVLPIELSKKMISSFGLLDDIDEEESAQEPAPAPTPAPAPAAAPAPPPAPPQQPIPPPMAAAPQPAQAPPPPPAYDPMLQPQPQPMYQQPVYQQPVMYEPRIINAHPQSVTGPPTVQMGTVAQAHPSNLDLIMQVPLQISVEIGRTKKLLKEILEFNSGTLVVLDKLAGENVDLFVNGQCVAKGDVVVVDDSFGVRITEIVNNDLI
ncbi:MAG: flagellar motor switch phosphatase FliY [Oscillospiraceae bacterium]|nr:flagellar motor switch phosphatase FliY [Oscillospiraceae bacterium]